MTFASWIAHQLGLGEVAYLLRTNMKRSRLLTHAEFLKYNDSLEKLNERFLCRVLIDYEFVLRVKELKERWGLTKFVETGTYDGDTSFFFSGIFNTVYTCDIVDHPKRPEFYFRGNIVYETIDSPRFLEKHKGEFKSGCFFFLDAHCGKSLPLRVELSAIFHNCEKPVICVDDFDVGNGLRYNSYGGQDLNRKYIEDLAPKDYTWETNLRSNRLTGYLFLYPQ